MTDAVPSHERASRPVFAGQDWRALEPDVSQFCHKVPSRTRERRGGGVPTSSARSTRPLMTLLTSVLASGFATASTMISPRYLFTVDHGYHASYGLEPELLLR